MPGKQYQDEWRKKNPEKVREHRRKYWAKAHSKEWGRQLRKRYGISTERYEEMFIEQKGLCGLCDQPGLLKDNGTVERLCVDHSHKTGQVRRLLCRACNFLVGRMETQPELHVKALEYIHRFEEQK
jgi:hypothetical protein